MVGDLLPLNSLFDAAEAVRSGIQQTVHHGQCLQGELWIQLNELHILGMGDQNLLLRPRLQYR